MKLAEGALISVTAFLLGLVAAYPHVFLFDASMFKPVLMGWSTLYPAFQLSPDLDGLQIASLALLTIVPYVTAILLPVWRAATDDPERVMR